jgi:predicted RNA methylase
VDRLIKRFDGVQDGDLVLCEARGVAYQRDSRAGRVSYDRSYYDKVCAYEGTPIARAVNAGRVALLRNWGKPGRLVDWGAGSGEFVRAARAAGYEAFGYEVLADAAAVLKAAHMWEENFTTYDQVTLWDVLEHLDDPGLLLRSVKKGALLLVSLPIFASLDAIRRSKHYRPGEHLHYWTRAGFVAWMALYNFRLLEESDHEVAAGREEIGAFAFRRDLPDYYDHIGLYDQMHSSRHYGESAVGLHLDAIARVVRDLNPASIIDYGCGRSDLAAHFWLDGARRIARYDPAIPRFKDKPEGKFDLALCTDVLEHIPMLGLEQFLAELREKSDTALFTISTKLARAKLPDGRNAHVTLLTPGEWTRWLASVFGRVERFETAWEHELLVLAGARARRPPAFRPCPGCGGELYADSWLPLRPKAEEEWVMRCTRCAAVVGLASGVATTRAQIEAAWLRQEAACAPAS